jgi:hypothetical protein
MRPSSARQWGELIANYRRLHVYTVDPGAHAVASELVPLVRSMGRLAGWYSDGWSARQEAETRPVTELLRALSRGDALVIGSQTNFANTQAMLKDATAAGVTTIFVFDHWKNYAEHFGNGSPADIIVVPDEIGAKSVVRVLGEDVRPRVRILPHLAIEAAADRIAASGVAEEAGTIALLLDPTEPGDGLGYDWRTALAAALDQETATTATTARRILVKPHPRQDVDAVAGELAARRQSGAVVEIFNGKTDDLIAMASEVWGMTTVALNVALALGKPIRSFQCGRNETGARASNPHIEPYLVKQNASAEVQWQQ